jgi:hypothetical protein
MQMEEEVMSRHLTTVGDVLVGKVGFRRATLVAGHIALWSVFREGSRNTPIPVRCSTRRPTRP